MPTRTESKLSRLFREARKSVGGTRNTSAIAGTMLFGRFWKAITEDEDIHRHLMRLGINQDLRREFKSKETGDDEGSRVDADADLEPEQLSLWPGDKQVVIKTINRACVYVPSRGEFIPLQPDKISRPEVNEAGNFLIAKGEESINKGELLVTLSSMPGPWIS